MKLKFYLRGLGLGIVVTAVVLGVGGKGRTAAMSDDEVINRAKELGMIENTVLSSSNDNEENGDEAVEQTQGEEGAADPVPTTAEEPVSTIAEETGTADPLSTVAEEAGMADPFSTMAEEPGAEDSTSTMAEEPGAEASASTMAEESGDRVADPTTAEEPGDTVSDPAAAEDTQTADLETEEAEPPIVPSTPEQTAATGVFIIEMGESAFSISRRLQEGGWVASADEFKKHLLNNGYDTIIVAASYNIPAGTDMDTIAKIITKYRTVPQAPQEAEAPPEATEPPAGNSSDT